MASRSDDSDGSIVCGGRGAEDGDQATDRAQVAVQAELGREHAPVPGHGGDGAGGGQDSNGDRQIEAAAVPGRTRRGQVHGDGPGGPVKSAVQHGGTDPVPHLPEAGLGHAADGERGRPPADGGLHLDQLRASPGDRGAAGMGGRGGRQSGHYGDGLLT